jgi:hypothetical protein
VFGRPLILQVMPDFFDFLLLTWPRCPSGCAFRIYLFGAGPPFAYPNLLVWLASLCIVMNPHTPSLNFLMLGFSLRLTCLALCLLWSLFSFPMAHPWANRLYMSLFPVSVSTVLPWGIFVTSPISGIKPQSHVNRKTE